VYRSTEKLSYSGDCVGDGGGGFGTRRSHLQPGPIHGHAGGDLGGGVHGPGGGYPGAARNYLEALTGQVPGWSRYDSAQQ